MKHFSDECETYNDEYEDHGLFYHREDFERDRWDSQMCAPMSLEDYDSMSDYESCIGHFSD